MMKAMTVEAERDIPAGMEREWREREEEMRTRRVKIFNLFLFRKKPNAK